MNTTHTSTPSKADQYSSNSMKSMQVGAGPPRSRFSFFHFPTASETDEEGLVVMIEYMQSDTMECIIHNRGTSQDFSEFVILPSISKSAASGHFSLTMSRGRYRTLFRVVFPPEERD
jgi:hypothetical protein